MAQGNHRTGRSRGYASQKGGARTVGWREDPHIQARIARVADLRFGKNWQIRRIAEQEGVSVDTIFDDLNHFYELTADLVESARGKTQARLDYVIRSLLERIEETQANSLNRGQYYGHLLRAIEMDGKIDGLFREKVEIEGGAPLVVQYIAPDSVPPATGGASDTQ